MRALALVLWMAAAAAAQPARTPAPTGAVVVEAGAAAVFVTPAGAPTRSPIASGTVVAVPAGAVHVAAVADASVWNAPRAEAEVTVAAGDTVRVTLRVPVRYVVETVPGHAAVALEADGTRRALGDAPLVLDLAPGEAGVLTAAMDGYATARAALDGQGGRVVLTLRPEGATEAAPPVRLLPTQRSRAARTLADVGIGALTLAAGAVAVYYKFEADRVDDRYRDPLGPERGSEALRDEAARLDRRSLVALGAMQVGLGVLAVRFVLR